jgi:hypothetical protein
MIVYRNFENDKVEHYISKWKWDHYCKDCNSKDTIEHDEVFDARTITCNDDCDVPKITECDDCGWVWNVCDLDGRDIPDEYFVSGGRPEWCPLLKRKVW